MIRIKQVKVPVDVLKNEEAQLKEMVLKRLSICTEDLIKLCISKKSLDARKRNAISFVYTVDVLTKNDTKIFNGLPQDVNVEYIEKETEYNVHFNLDIKKQTERPIVVGFGPAGMFCALLLARNGLNPLVIERGKKVEERSKDVKKFWNEKELNINSNVQFGEGGAGTFSDGKLTTLVKDKQNRSGFILKEFVNAGAPGEILYINKPHIGTDNLRAVVKNIREEIIGKGGEILFETTLVDIDIDKGATQGIVVSNSGENRYIKATNVFLALGHSARDTFTMLKEHVPLSQKPFAVGLRIEHLQREINKVQYKGYEGKFKLGAADYKLAYNTSKGRGVYTFCMCPGGVVVAAASEQGMIVTNGMSFYNRDKVNANSAILVNITPADFGSDDVLAGMHFQRDLERKAFVLGGSNWFAPVQKVSDFLKNRPTKSFGSVTPSYTGTVTGANLREILPKFMSEAIGEGIVAFNNQLIGFNNPDAILTGVESRSSSPIRILRNDNYMSDIKGIWPIGEGAGYAGGIMSAAMDGMKSAEEYVRTLE